MVPLEPFIDVAVFVRDAFGEGPDGLGSRDVGHHELVLEAHFFVVKTRLHVVDGPAVLDGDHATGRETTSVADSVDLVEDRDARVAGAQEVRVQRVNSAVLDRPAGRHQRLGRDLAAEGALAFLGGVLSSEGVELDRLDVKEFHKEI